MTIKEAIASLKIDAENVGFDTDEDDMLPQAKRFIEAVKTVSDALESPRDWTPCAEGLPENSRYVLITLPHSTEAVQAYYLNGEWYNAVNQPISAELVIAWMPKPAPYNPDHIRDTAKKVEDAE